MRLLLVEDNEDLAELVTKGLAAAGFAADAVATAQDAREVLATKRYAAVVLDLGLPDADGLKVLQSLRQPDGTLPCAVVMLTEAGSADVATAAMKAGALDYLTKDRLDADTLRRAIGSAVPILMLTARTAEVDRVVGLEAGADDYIVKPFSMPELVARVRAMLRRRELDLGEATNGVKRVGGLELDLSRHTATVEGQRVQLTNSEFRLLRMLAECPGRVYSRRELMQETSEPFTAPPSSVNFN